MSKFDKLLIKMRANPRDWRIDDLKVVAERLGEEGVSLNTLAITLLTQGLEKHRD